MGWRGCGGAVGGAARVTGARLGWEEGELKAQGRGREGG